MGSQTSLPLPAEFKEVCELVRGLARRVADIEACAVSTDQLESTPSYSDEELAIAAASIYRLRFQRANQFDPTLFGEPAWDMLLDLFIQRVKGKRVSTTGLCLGADVPHSTGLRHIERLCDEAILRRSTAKDDKRLILIELTPKGLRLMRDYLSNAVAQLKVQLPE